MGVKDQPSPCQLLPDALGWIFGRWCVQAAKSCKNTFISAGQDAIPAVLPSIGLWKGRIGDEWQQHKQTGRLCTPRGPALLGKQSGWWGSPACYGICSHSDGVKTGHGTKDVCQLPCGEDRTLLFPLGFLSLWISLPSNDFLGHVILAWSKSVTKC